MFFRTSRQSLVPSHVPCGSGDCFKYAATPMMLDMIALAEAIAIVERNPDCRLKWAGSIPTAANPVMTPLAPPAIAAAAIPLSQVSNMDMTSPA
jgi:hypothetical protein